MARGTAKTSKVNRATPTPVGAGIAARTYDHDLDQWPRSWMGWEKDLPPGEELVACFRPFIAHLAASDLTPKTIRRHVDSLWRLGGRIITDLNESPKLRKRPTTDVLWEAIDDDEGGPLINGGMDEQDQRSFDATCRKLRRFLSQRS
ncbi:MAG: hypothetical protein R2762_09680 [Bryobacteraceae bacterium]